MRKKGGENRKIGYSFLAASILALTLWLCGSKGLAYTAAVAAGLAMPEGAYASVVEQLQMESAPESTAVEETAAVLQQDHANGMEARTAAAEKSADLSAVPADIKALIAVAESKTDNAKKLGNIVEKDYNKNGMTHSYQNVRVKNNSGKSLNIEAVLGQKPELLVKDKTKPAVLIFHTHTTESYQILERKQYSSKDAARSNNEGENMIRVGAEIAKQLEAAGYSVIHDKTVHDTSYSGAYDRSRETLKRHLAEHPEIQVVLDVHRDAIHQAGGNKIKPTAQFNGKKAAQVMIITGVEGGNVKGFPNWEKNLRFALQLQRKMEGLYPGLTRPVLFSQRKYTMDLHPCNVLLEMGSDVNTLDEAVYSGRLVGNALVSLLEEYTK